MELIVKAELFDCISDTVTKDINIQFVKEILYEKDGCSSDQAEIIV